jgi:hypothetical protein
MEFELFITKEVIFISFIIIIQGIYPSFTHPVASAAQVETYKQVGMPQQQE